MARIVTLTMNPAIDRTIMVDRVVPERKLRTGPPRFEPGGGGVNVARAVTRLGGEALAVFPSGGDAGRLLERLLTAERVPHQPVRISGLTRENITVEETSTRQDFRFVLPGPQIDSGDVETCYEAMLALTEPGSYVVVSGSLPASVDPAFVARLAAEVKRRGARFVLDSTGEPLRRALEAGVFMCKPNLRELCEIAGAALEDDAAQERAVQALLVQDRAEIVLASLGAGGAYLAWKGGTARLRTPAVPIRSRVGAGDSTVAGMVLRLVEGWSVLDAATYGIAAGAAAVMTHGSELCRREDTERLYKTMKRAAGQTP
jgi:6-phosphofructokinase 2